MRRADERGPAVELADDLEDALLDRSRRGARGEPPTDGEVRRRPLDVRDQRIGRLPHAVMQKLVGPLLPQQEPGPYRRPKGRVRGILGSALDKGQGSDRRTGAETGQPLQDGSGGGGQAAQLAQHEIRDIVGVAFGAYPPEIPSPASRIAIEYEQPFLGQCGQKLDGEERIPSGLLMHKPGQGPVAARVQGVGNDPVHIPKPERLQDDLLHPPARLADRRQPPHQGMRGHDLVIPIGADKKQVMQIPLCQQVLEEIERGCIEPLQVVEEQRQRMLRPGEDPDETPQHQVKSALRVSWRQLRRRRLRANEEFEVGEQRQHERAVRAKRRAKRGAPGRQLGLVLSQKRPDQVHEGLRQAGVGDVTLVLVELAGCEQAARRRQRGVQLMHHRGLADSGLARDQDQLRPTPRDNAIESGAQGLDLALSPVQPLGDYQAIRQVPLA